MSRVSLPSAAPAAARVRSLYDSEAVLRQAAAVLHELGWSEPVTTIGARAPSEKEEIGARHELTLARQASLLAALRRSREVVDTVARMLQSRAAAKQNAAK